MRTVYDDFVSNNDDGSVNVYEFHELSAEAQGRVISEYIEERANDPYFGQWFADCYEQEIWDCVRDLEKSITGARVRWSYNRWYSCDFDCEFSYDDCYDPGYVETVKDTGYYASMDICDAWNKHARKLNGLYYQYRHLDYLCWEVYNEWDSNVYEEAPQNASFFRRADALRDIVVSRWYQELEKACEDVRNEIETLLCTEWDYYTSEEYTRTECEDEYAQGYECHSTDDAGRVYYSDTRKWYLASGEFYEQSSINHECVSIVKAG